MLKTCRELLGSAPTGLQGQNSEVSNSVKKQALKDIDDRTLSKRDHCGKCRNMICCRWKPRLRPTRSTKQCCQSVAKFRSLARTEQIIFLLVDRVGTLSL